MSLKMAYPLQLVIGDPETRALPFNVSWQAEGAKVLTEISKKVEKFADEVLDGFQASVLPLLVCQGIGSLTAVRIAKLEF